MNMIGTMLADDDSLSHQQIALIGISQTTVKKIILSVSLSRNFRRGVRLRFYVKPSYGRPAVFFLGNVTNSGLRAVFFFYFFDSWRSRLVTGLVSLLKTQPS